MGSIHSLRLKLKRKKFEWGRWWHRFPLLPEKCPNVHLVQMPTSVLPPEDLEVRLVQAVGRVWNYLRTLQPATIYDYAHCRQLLRAATVGCSETKAFLFYWAEGDLAFPSNTLDGRYSHEGVMLLGSLAAEGITFVDFPFSMHKSGRKRGFVRHTNHLEYIILAALMVPSAEETGRIIPDELEGKIGDAADHCFPHSYEFLRKQEVKSLGLLVPTKAA